MPRQTVPPVACRLSTACCSVALPLLWFSALTQTEQSQPWPSARGGHSVRQSVSASGKLTTASRAWWWWMPSGGARSSSSSFALVLRAANAQWSPLWNRPPAGSRLNSTRTPCSRNRRVPSGGIRIAPVLAGASRSWPATALPSSRRTWPDWSQRRTRVLRKGSVACCGSVGNSPALSG